MLLELQSVHFQAMNATTYHRLGIEPVILTKKRESPVYLVRQKSEENPHKQNSALVDFGGPLVQIQRFGKRAGPKSLCHEQVDFPKSSKGGTRYHRKAQA